MRYPTSLVKKGSSPFPDTQHQTSDGERAIRQLATMFARLRHTVPFPVPMMQVYEPLLPKIKLKEVLVKGETVPINYQNLRLSIMWGHVVHVSLDSYDDYCKAISGQEEFASVFHMTFKDEVIVPDAMTHPFRMDETHPHWDAIVDWISRASNLEMRNEHLLSKLNSYLKRTGSAASVRLTFPELLNYVKLRGPSMAHVSDATLRKIRDHSSLLQKPHLKKEVIDKLNAATLLENDQEPAAWISFKQVSD
jgi:hypothetical protein